MFIIHSNNQLTANPLANKFVVRQTPKTKPDIPPPISKKTQTTLSDHSLVQFTKLAIPNTTHHTAHTK